MRRRYGDFLNTAQAVLLGSALGQLGVALLVTIYLARVLSPAAFGFFSLVGTSFHPCPGSFSTSGSVMLPHATLRMIHGGSSPILEGMMAYRRAAGVALALALFVFAFVQKSGPERSVLLLVGVVLLFTEPAALDPVFQVRQAQGGPALLNLFGGILVLGGSVFFQHLGDCRSGVCLSAGNTGGHFASGHKS